MLGPSRLIPTKHNNYYDSDARKAERAAKREMLKTQYNYEKLIGTRRKDGIRKLKKLTFKHREMIAQFLSGMSIMDVAYMHDISYHMVWYTLSDPLAQEYIDEHAASQKAEFNAMLGQVNMTIRDGLESGGITNRLKAVDRWAKIHRVVNGDGEGESGKSKTQEIMAARFRFIEQVKKVAQEQGVIEAEAVFVSETSNDSS